MAAVRRSVPQCLRTGLLVAVMLAAESLSLRAQDTVAAPLSGGPRLCTYDTCALRMESGVFSERIREGVNGPTHRLGYSGASLVRLVASVPTARVEAERGRRQRIRGGLAMTVGGLVLGQVLASTSSPDASTTARHWITAVGSTAAGIYGGVQLSRSGQSFSRAVWLYNREVSRGLMR